ncbi:Olfactory receptor 2M3 [Sciurus carolinensis]|uniref:Olfactory receptor n=1 Tax=Sciurus carolinensis TaxID=30640 RepID=A0AA41MJF6_SCICA|nr:Olfactory receptor 2M3 [Sciurus carolinensis]
MDLMLICTTIPKMAFNYLSGRNTISLAGCGTQIFFYVSLMGAECFLLAAMAYDRYVAICHPLRYLVLMSQKVCGLIAASSWVLGSLDGIIEAPVALSFPYCGSGEIPHFFCDVPALLTLACMDTLTFERMIFICCIIMLLFPVAIIIASYARVILAVIRMGSGEGRRKAFTTCSSHLMVVGMYYGAAMFTYMRLTSNRSPMQDKIVLAFYTILTPMLNPLIYSLRNREVSRAFVKVHCSVTMASHTTFSEAKDLQAARGFLFLLFYLVSLAYLKPVPESPRPVDFWVSVLYSGMPPSLNPVIISLRNKDVRTSLWKILHHYKF